MLLTARKYTLDRVSALESVLSFPAATLQRDHPNCGLTPASAGKFLVLPRFDGV